MSSTGENPRQLTTSRSRYDASPSFSSDGETIVFVRYVAGFQYRPGTAGVAEIFTIAVDGSNETRITNNDAADFSPSFLDDDTIVYDVWAENIFTTRGGQSQPLTKGSSASPSPDGNTLVFISGEYGRQISTIDREGTNESVIVTRDNYMSTPSFSADGMHVIYLDEPDASGTGVVCLLELESGSERKLFDTNTVTPP